MEETGRHIPEKMKREIRKRCGFGCIICGLPIYDYEHIVDFAQVVRHDPDNIVLLCPNHHAEKTRGRIERAVIDGFAQAPFNNNKLNTAPYRLHMVGRTARFVIGGNEYTYDFTSKNEFTAIIIDGEPFASFCFEEGFLLPTLKLNNAEMNTLVSIDKGELELATNVADITYVGKRVTITYNGLRVIYRYLDDGIAVDEGTFYGKHHSLHVAVSDHTIQPCDNRFSGCRFSGNDVGICVG